VARPDVWLDAASALRHTVLDVPGVVALSTSAVYQTHGRGAAVAGVALKAVPEGFRADLGIVLDADAAIEPGRIGAISRLVEQAAQATWHRLGSGSPLEVCVHVLDVGF
jgi:hypothetical protein